MFWICWLKPAVLYSVVSRFLARVQLRKYHPHDRKPRPYPCSRPLFIQGHRLGNSHITSKWSSGWLLSSSRPLFLWSHYEYVCVANVESLLFWPPSSNLPPFGWAAEVSVSNPSSSLFWTLVCLITNLSLFWLLRSNAALLLLLFFYFFYLKQSWLPAFWKKIQNTQEINPFPAKEFVLPFLVSAKNCPVEKLSKSDTLIFETFCSTLECTKSQNSSSMS